MEVSSYQEQRIREYIQMLKLMKSQIDEFTIKGDKSIVWLSLGFIKHTAIQRINEAVELDNPQLIRALYQVISETLTGCEGQFEDAIYQLQVQYDKLENEEAARHAVAEPEPESRETLEEKEKPPVIEEDMIQRSEGYAQLLEKSLNGETITLDMFNDVLQGEK